MTADDRGAEERRQKLFETRRAAAMLKHAILGRYLVPFAAKAGYSTDHHRVVIIDGYAGAGRYEDGKPGSPMLIAAAAKNVALRDRKLEGRLVERDPVTFTRLQQVLHQEAGAELTWDAQPGEVATHLDTFLARGRGGAAGLS